MKPLRPTATALVALAVLALAACVPSEPTPRPTATSTSSATPDESESPTPTPTTDDDVAAAIVVVTASAITVFGTDGSTLASETYRTDAATVAAHLADALDEDAIVSNTGPIGASCDASDIYEFGGLELVSPGGLGSAGSVGSGDLYAAYVSGTNTAGGVAIETVAGQHVGSTRAAFEAAVGDEMQFEQYGPDVYGFDILNPEAGPYDMIGVQAWFEGDRMTAWEAPAALGFIGDCG